MANKVTIDVEARFVDNVSAGSGAATKSVDDLGKKAEQTQKKVETLGKKKVKPTLDADDGRLVKKLREAEAKAAKIGRTKTSLVLNAVDKATTVISKVLGKAKSFSGKIFSSMVKIKDSEALASLRRVGEQAKNIAGKTWTTLVKIKDFATSPLTKIKNMLFSIKALVLAITAGMAAKQFILNPINLADAYSSAQIGFATLLGEKGGQAMMDQIDSFAKATPFKTSGVISNVQKMMAYGWDASRVIEDMKTIGDAAAATGKGDEGLTSIVYALSEIRSKGKLSTQELNQLASAGIKAKQYLAEGLGYGTSDQGLMQLAKDLEGGAIGANQAVELILEGMKEFDGMMDKTANETVEGLWGQITDTFEINIFRRWGQGLQDGARKGFGSIVTLLDKADGSLKEFGDTVYEVGKTISNYLADTLRDVVDRVNEITDSKAFQDASIGDKIKMLWEGAIANPFADWWNSTVVPWWNHTVIPWITDKAASLGKTIGTGLSNAILTLLGADVVGVVETGASVAGSFVKGFTEGFDSGAIAKAFADAFSKLWSAMPWWVKALLFGYGTAKIGGLLTSLSGGLSVLGGTLGSASNMTGLLGFGTKAAISMGAGNLAGGASLGAGGLSTLGLSSTGGFIAGAATVIDGGVEIYNGIANNDSNSLQKGAWKVGGSLGGAGVGAALGSFIPVLGTIAGAGLGALFGSFIGNLGASGVDRRAQEAAEKAAKKAEAEAKREAELAEAIQKGMVDHFGDVSLSADEINTALNNMFGREVIARANAASDAIEQVNSSLQAFDSADFNLKKGVWLTTLTKEAKLTDAEVQSLDSSAKEFSKTAESYLTDSRYASSEAITAIMGTAHEAQDVIDKSTEYYDAKQHKLKNLTDALKEQMEKALSDNVISVDENKSIQRIRSQITDIIAQIQSDRYEADMNIIKAKYSDPDMSLESFSDMMEQSVASAQELADGFWEQFGQGSVGLEEGSDEWNKLLEYTLNDIAAVFADAGNLGIDKLQTKWADELGILGDDLASVLKNNAGSEIVSAVNGLSDVTGGEIAKMLEYMQPTTDQIQELADSYTNMGLQIPEALKSYLDTVEFYEALSEGPKAVEEFFKNQKIDVDPKIEMDPDILLNYADTTGLFEVNADVGVHWTYDAFDDEWISPDGKYSFTTDALVDAGWTYNEFEKKWISPDSTYSFTTNAAIKVNYQVNKFNGFRTDFGISSTYAFKQKVLIDQEARGGIVGGGSSSLEGFAAGGMVRGGARIIKVAEEGTPEMIIPLGSQRRERGLKLWSKAGEMLGVPGFARGGLTDRNQDQGFRFRSFGTDESAGGQTVQIEVGGITVEIHVDARGYENIAEAIEDQKNEIAETVAGILADAIGGQYENIPLRGGVA